VKECFELLNTLANSPSIGAEMLNTIVSKHRLTDIIIVKECFELLNTLVKFSNSEDDIQDLTI